MARNAAKQRKELNPPGIVVIHPVAIRYFCGGDVKAALTNAMAQRDRGLESLQTNAVMEYSNGTDHVKAREELIVRRPGSAFWFFALPLILLFLVALVFAHGHPFERRHVAVVGIAPAVLDADVRAGALAVDAIATEDAALARLESVLNDAAP